MLKEKVVLITGGSAGVGESTVRRCCKEGAKVIFTDVDLVKGEKLKEELLLKYKNIVFLEADVSDESDWERVEMFIENQFGVLDCLFNNAGVFQIETIAATSVELWDHIMTVNAKGVFLGIKYMSKFMVKNNSGSIVNASSIASIIGSKNRIAYAASKGAVSAMTKAAAIELAPYHIRVNSTHPSYVNTNMAEHASLRTQRSLKEMGVRIPLGNRISEPDEIAALVVFLFSEESKFITGTEMVIDGGQTAN